MTQTRSLALLVEVSETNAERAAHHLAQANRELAQANARLDLLARYQDEYQQRFAQALASGVDASLIANYRAFLAQLNQAIEEQRGAVARSTASRGASERDWRAKQHRVKSFETLVKRAQAEQAQAAARVEQLQTDERALGLWLRNGNRRRG